MLSEASLKSIRKNQQTKKYLTPKAPELKSMHLVKNFHREVAEPTQFDVKQTKKISKTFKSFVRKKDIINLFLSDTMRIESHSLSEIKIKTAALRFKFKQFMN